MSDLEGESYAWMTLLTSSALALIECVQEELRPERASQAQAANEQMQVDSDVPSNDTQALQRSAAGLERFLHIDCKGTGSSRFPFRF